MHRARLAAVVVLASCLVARPHAAAASKVCAFSIPAEMVDKVESKDARSGGTFRFRTTQEVQIGNGITIPSGTIGYGIVREADPAGRRDHDGSLALEPRYLDVLKPRPQAGSKAKGGGLTRVDVTMDPTLPVVWTPRTTLIQQGMSHVPLPVPGIAMTAINQVRWGRNVTLGPGFKFAVIPASNLSQGPIC